MLEHGERAEVLWVVTISHAWDLIVVPTEKASFNGRLESTEDLDVRQLSRLVARLTACSVVALVALHLLNDSPVVLDQPLLQCLPLIWPNARVQSCKLPESDKFVAHAGASILACLRVGVDVVLALSCLLECNLGVEPPDHYLGSLQALEGDNLQKGEGIAVVALVHLPHNREQVPHALRLPTCAGIKRHM